MYARAFQGVSFEARNCLKRRAENLPNDGM